MYFTLYELQQDLQANKHSYNINEIKEALKVLHKAHITLSNLNGDILASSTLLPELLLINREDIKNRKESKDGEKRDMRAFAKLNPLVSRSIMSLGFRQYDYQLAMKLKTHARYLYIRMSHNHKQSSRTKPYPILLSTFFRDRGLEWKPRMDRNRSTMEIALQDLLDHGIIERWVDEEIVTRPRRKSIVTDLKYLLYPTDKMVKQVKRANHFQKQARLVTSESQVQK